jgi:DNA-binding CsgD family transcriptional regulator
MDFIRPMMDFLDSLDDGEREITPNYSRIRHVRVLDILKLLPRINCRKCGFSACMAFAAAVARGKALADQCPFLAHPSSVTGIYPVIDRQGNLVDSLALRVGPDGIGRRDRSGEQGGMIGEGQGRGIPGAEPPARGLPQAESAAPSAALTARETEVLALIARGNTNNEIGGLLFISPHTVKSHMINIFNKFGVSDRTQAAVMGVRTGLI